MFKKIFFNVTKCSVMESLYIYTLHVLLLEYSLYTNSMYILYHMLVESLNPFLSSKSSERYLHQNSNFVNFRCCYFDLLWTSNKKLWRFYLNRGSFTSPKILLLKHKENNNNNICILCHILCFTHKFHNKWFDILPLQVSQTEFKLL